MGEAKRRRSEAANMVQRGTVQVGVVGDPSGVTTATINVDERHAGSLSAFMDEFARQNPHDRRSSVPCGTCRQCCWHPTVDVDKSVERPEDLAHLDLVVREDGKTVIRKRPDGACVHLGDGGCTVYKHRPRACRSYDCRIYSAFGILPTFNGDRHAPYWKFTLRSVRDYAVAIAARLSTMLASVDGHDDDNSAMQAAGHRYSQVMPRSLTALMRIPASERDQVIASAQSDGVLPPDAFEYRAP